MSEPPSPTFPAIEEGSAFELGDTASSLVHATLGTFEIHDVLGKGGMGIVFSGVHLTTRVPVAIKVITRRGAAHPHFRRSMHNEVRAVASLDHPGIIRVLDYGDISSTAEALTDGALRAGSPYFVMELVPHGSLIDLVGRVDWRQGKAILLTLLDALAHSHAREVIHRDIKPGNILIDDWGGRVIPRLADFGLAFALDAPTDASRSVGTPQYMAPEQIETPWREHGPWSDLYSLGCVAYELFAGRKLFQGRSIIEIFRLHLDGVRRPLRSVVQLPPEFRGWLERMLARDVADRFQTAADAARALAAIDDAELPDVRPPERSSHSFAALSPVLDAVLGDEDVPRFTWPRRSPRSMRLVGAGLGLHGLREIPLVGRKDELGQLHDAFQRTIGEGARAISIVGAEGVGKTKLAEAFAERLAELGLATKLRVDLTTDGSRDGLALLFASLFRLLGADRIEAAGVVRERLAQLGCDDTFLWRAAAEIVTPAVSDSPGSVEEFEFSSKELRLESALRILGYHASRRPVVIVLDDVHRDLRVVEFVHHVLAKGSHVPVLFVVTATEEELPEHPEAAELLETSPEANRIRRMELEPLDEVTHLELVQKLLHLTGDVAIELAARTAGNPRLASALVDDWVERGVLAVEETGFVPKGDLSDRIPDSLVEVWSRRLEELLEERPESRPALEIAAALGTDVHFDEWTGVCAEENVEVDLELVDVLIARRLADEGRERWSFTHPGIRESLRRGAESRGTWRRWKAACARYLVKTGRRRVEVLTRIGFYWLDAGEPRKAFELLVESARIRERQGDYRSAEEVIGAATHAVDALGGADERSLAELWILRARTYAGWGRPDESLRWARRAHELAAARGWGDLDVNAIIYIALAKQWMGARDGASWLERAVEALDLVSSQFISDGRALLALAYVMTSLGRFTDAERILQIDEQSCADERGRAGNDYQRCRLAIYRRQYEEARRYGQNAHEYYHSVGHVPALAATIVMLAEVERKTGNLERAEELYRSATELHESLGQFAAFAKTSLGEVLVERGRFGAAEEIFLEALHEAAAANRKRLEMACRAGLLVCSLQRGQANALAKFLPRVEEFVRETHEADPSIAELLERAAGFATGEDSVRIWNVAIAQWELLGDEERVRNARAALDELCSA